MKKSMITITICILACMMLVGCHGEIRDIWTGSSGRVPASVPAVDGFTIRPLNAQLIAEKQFGMRKSIQHVYADSRYYYIVDGFFGAKKSKIATVGWRVDGRTGKCLRFDRP
jgi:hypothetical protein